MEKYKYPKKRLLYFIYLSFIYDKGSDSEYFSVWGELPIVFFFLPFKRFRKSTSEKMVCVWMRSTSNREQATGNRQRGRCTSEDFSRS